VSGLLKFLLVLVEKTNAKLTVFERVRERKCENAHAQMPIPSYSCTLRIESSVVVPINLRVSKAFDRSMILL
jgi:hypothetical protein